MPAGASGCQINSVLLTALWFTEFGQGRTGPSGLVVDAVHRPAGFSSDSADSWLTCLPETFPVKICQEVAL